MVETRISRFPKHDGNSPHSVIFIKAATGKIRKYILRARQPGIAPQ
jgi:hypothetical protein